MDNTKQNDNHIINKLKQTKICKKILEHEKINKLITNKFWKELAKNSVWAFLGDGIAAVINLVILMILIKLIGDNATGLFILSQTYTLILDVILNIQSWKSVIYYGQHAIVKNRIDELDSYVKLGAIIDVFTAILGGIIAIVAVPFVAKYLNWNHEMILATQIFSATIFSHLAGTSIAILRISNKFNLVAVQKVVSALLKILAILTLFLFKQNISLLTVVIIYALTEFLGNLLLVYFAIKEYNKKYDFKRIIYSKLPNNTKEFLKFTLWGSVSEILDIPVNYLDVFIVSILGNDKVVIYKVFKQCVGMISKVTTPIQQSILPQFSELVAKEEREKAYNVVKKIRNVTLKYMGPLIVLVSITSPIWLKILFAKQFAENWYVLFIYLIIQTVALSYTAIHPLFVSLGKVKEDAIITLFANGIYLIFAYMIVNILGLLGMVFAFMVQAFLMISLKDIIIKKNIKKIRNTKSS